MAETLTYPGIISAIRAGRIAPVYILSGDEPYYIDKITELLQSVVVRPEDADFNLDVFYGAETDPAVVVTAARQFPSFAERRLVMLKEAQAMSRAKSALDVTRSYMEHPSPSTVLVIAYKGEAIPATAKWVKAAAANGAVVFVSKKARDYQLPPLIKDFCHDIGADIDEKSAVLLAEYVGTDLSRLFGEIEKLRHSVGEGERLHITPELIERNIGISKEYNNFELTDALLMKNYAKAMRIAKYFGANQKDNPAPVTAAVIFNTFVKLLRAHYLKDKSDASLRSKLGAYNSMAINQIKRGMQNYSAGSCVRIIREIRRFDCATKGIDSMQPTDGLLIELIYKIFTS